MATAFAPTEARSILDPLMPRPGDPHKAWSLASMIVELQRLQAEAGDVHVGLWNASPIAGVELRLIHDGEGRQFLDVFGFNG